MKIQHKLIIFSAALLLFPAALIFVLFRLLRFQIYFSQNNFQSSRDESILKILIDNYSFFLVICMILGIFLVIISSVFFLNSILKPLKDLQKAAKEIENGNLDYEIYYPYDDDYKTVFTQFDRMRMRLKDLLWQQIEQEKNRTELLANIAHDLKTPITSIKGYTQALCDGIANTPEKQERYLTTIIQKADDLNRMADALYSFSRLEVKQMSFDMQTVEVSALINDLINESILQQNDLLQFKHHIDIMHPTYIRIDIGLFRRVITNIITNSMKYTSNDIVHLTLNVYENENNVIFAFADDGIGVNDSDLDHIFERFYRSDRARQNTGNGSGLGLSICQQIIQAFDGSIWARHNTPSGLIVLISLPKESEANFENSNH